MINRSLFSSQTDEWETPQDFYDKLNGEFHFTLDPCASDANHKCEKYFTKKQNGLNQSWKGHCVFCNPPYGKSIIAWVEKAYIESRDEDTTVVMFIPARTDTQWFHNFVFGKAEIRFIKGRIKFGGAKYNAPFPSMVVIFGRKKGENNA